MSPAGPQLDWYYGRRVEAVEESPKFVIELTGGVKIISNDPPVPADQLVGAIFTNLILGGTSYSRNGNTTELVFNRKGESIRIALTAGYYEIIDPARSSEAFNPQRGPLPEVTVHPGVSERLVEAAKNAKPMTQEEIEQAERDGKLGVHGLHGQRAPGFSKEDLKRDTVRPTPKQEKPASGRTRRPRGK